ncbi:MAG: AbrB/MazE/SpoVT family DNA-binding domain-containing protein [Deltaproteobacteria bacterium]
MRARISSKGQLVIPTEIRRRRGLDPGAEVDVEEVPEGVLLRPVRSPAEATLDELLGCTGYHGPTRTLRDMEDGIREGAEARR